MIVGKNQFNEVLLTGRPEVIRSQGRDDENDISKRNAFGLFFNIVCYAK